MKLKILYEDEAVIVVHKPAGFPVQTRSAAEMDCVSELKNYLGKKGKNQPGAPRYGTGNRGCARQKPGSGGANARRDGNAGQPYLGIVHRLDQPVEGIMVFAKTAAAAADLSRQVSAEDGCRMVKRYEARVYGRMPEREGELEDYLVKEAGANISRIVTPAIQDGEKLSGQAKLCRLAYRVLSETAETQLLAVELYTGRHHQIRAQLSHAGAPILGDGKYGTEESVRYSMENGFNSVELRAVSLEFAHPVTGKIMKWEHL